MHHLEVGDGNAPGIAEEIWYNVNSLVVENIVCGWRGGAIGQLCHNRGLNLLSIAPGNDIFQGGGEEDNDRELQKILIGNIFCLGKVND